MKSPKYCGESMKASKAARGENYASGGAVKPVPMKAGAGSGLGRIEKAKAAKRDK